MRVNPIAAALLLTIAASAHAANHYVANDGVDTAGCGAKDSPCRSITRAIDNASDGDTVIVGPGRYGDLNGDGQLDDPGDETGAPFLPCLVAVRKAITVTSSDGAAPTIIDARSVVVAMNVLVITNDAVFGKPAKGFTVTQTKAPDGGTGIAIVGSVSNVTVRGNQVTSVSPTTGALRGIAMLPPAFPGDPTPGPILIEGNQVTGWLEGVVARGVATTARKNVISTNNTGIAASEDGLVTGNVVSNNAVAMSIDGARVVGNAIVGNGVGLVVEGASVVEKNNIVSNSGCGLGNFTVGGLPATGNYWGAPTGPGPAPADEVCHGAGATETVVPFAAKPYNVDPSIKP